MDKSKEFNEWVDFAEKDLLASEILSKNHPKPLEIICFHCQQCAEKYLKAYLVYNENEFEKTHNLILLNSFCIKIDNSFNNILNECIRLNIFSVNARYPSNIEINEKDSETALNDVKNIKSFIMGKINT
jgi:HEPN domain-containing protein